MKRKELFEKIDIAMGREKFNSDKGVSKISEKMGPTDVLVRLYSQSSNKLKKEFVNHLINFNTHACSYVPFEVLLKIKKLESAFTIFCSQKPLAENKIIMLGRLYGFLLHESSLFSEIELKFIESQIEQDMKKVVVVKIEFLWGGYKTYEDEIKAKKQNVILDYENKILDRINRLRFEKVEKELEGEIIKEDLNKVSEKIGHFKLSLELSKALVKIRSAFDKAEDEFDYAKETGYLRTFLDYLIKHVAKKIAEKMNEEIPKIPESSEFTNNKKYLESKKIITKNEGRFISIFHSVMLSASGSHKLISKKERYRLSFNMVIELSLLILTRFENFVMT